MAMETVRLAPTPHPHPSPHPHPTTHTHRTSHPHPTSPLTPHPPQVGLAALTADRAAWGAPRQQCLAPSSACEVGGETEIETEMGGAPLGAPHAAGMTRACHAHYAGVYCDAVVR